MTQPDAETTVVLHDYWRSSASYRVRIALALKGIAYRRISVDLLSGDQRGPENLRVNPQGLVPTLEIDGHRLTQSLAILEYLEETRPEPALLPAQPVVRALVRSVALAIACEIHPVSNLTVLARVAALAGPEARARWNSDNIRSGLVGVEALIARMDRGGPFVAGPEPGFADCALIPQLYNARRWSVGFDDLPRLCGIEAAAAAHPAFQAALPENFVPATAPAPVA